MVDNHTSLLRNRNFVLLWCAYFVSAIGDHLSEMAILKTQNALSEEVDITPLTARMTLVFMLPFFVCGPLMGYFADRLSRRRLMIFADICRMAIMVGFVALLGWFTPLSTAWGPFLPLLLVGIFAAMFSPARSALLPTLITTEQLVPANALIRGVGVIATVVSVGVGGYLADNHDPVVAFRLDAMTFLASAVFVFFIVAPRGGRHATGSGTRTTRGSLFDDISGGFRYVFKHRRVRQIFAVGTVFWFSAAAIRNVVPAIVKGPYACTVYSDISMFLVLMVAGMVAGALILTGLKDALRSEIAVTWSLIGAGLGAFVLTVSTVLPIPPGARYWIGGAGVIGLGICGSALIASYNALLQRIVPDRYRGRVYGVLDLCVIGGLLIASGLLGIPEWPGLDQWVGYVVLGVAVLLTGSGLFSLWIRFAEQNRRQHLSHALIFARNLNEFLCKFWYRLKREGHCTIPAHGPVIVTANHTVSADPMMIYAASGHRRIAFMIAQEFANVPIARWFVRLIECIPVRRDGQDAAATKAAIRRLNAGEALAIFIEGRIPEPGEEVPPKDGVAMLALRTGATVIPVHLRGNRYCESVVRGLFLRHRTRVRFGPPVDLSEFNEKPSREQIAHATAKIHQAILDLAPAGSA